MHVASSLSWHGHDRGNVHCLASGAYKASVAEDRGKREKACTRGRADSC